MITLAGQRILPAFDIVVNAVNFKTSIQTLDNDQKCSIFLSLLVVYAFSKERGSTLEVSPRMEIPLDTYYIKSNQR